MTERGRGFRLSLVVGTVMAGFFGAVACPQATPRAGADTDPTTLVGEGGSFLSPVTNLLLNADPGFAPLNPSYSDAAGIDSAIADFVGSGPGQFSADFVVSERALTASEAQTAKSNGRSFAYIPFAATPVAIATLAVCNPSDLTKDVITSATFCRSIPLTPALVGAIFTSGLTSTSVQPNSSLPTTLSAWSDTRLTQAGGSPIPDGDGIGLASVLGPSAENSALMALIDSDPTAKEELDNALNNPANSPSTTSDAPNEIWPFQGQHAYIGGDAGMLGKELTINPKTNAPSDVDGWGGLGIDAGNAHDAFPVSAVWTGSPLGTPWNIPTAAIQNAAGQFVAPTEAAAAAAESDSTLASTSDPTTNNLVAFNPSQTDAAAYNNFLMTESYLVVPTNGLPADKATKLAQFIRFVLGPTGQSDIKLLGAAPATSTMVTAGLKVAAQLTTGALSGTTSTSSTSTTSTSSTSTTSTSSTSTTSTSSTTTPSTTSTTASSTGATTTTSTTATAAVSTAASQGSSSVGSNASSGTLAFTGVPSWYLATAGGTLVIVAESLRRFLRRRRTAS